MPLALFPLQPILAVTPSRKEAAMKQPLCVAPGKKIRLRDFDADYTGGIK